MVVRESDSCMAAFFAVAGYRFNLSTRQTVVWRESSFEHKSPKIAAAHASMDV